VAIRKVDMIRAYLAERIDAGAKDIITLAVARFGISRQTISKHLANMVSEGILTARGRTRGRVYELRTLARESVKLDLSAQPAEDKVWQETFAALSSGLRKNVRDICYHGFTEIFNNAVEHSEGHKVFAKMELTYVAARVSILDDGVGIFAKIKDHLGLGDEREAILELAKGKVTTDPESHTGEGIFFTTRMFDTFSICSGSLVFSHWAPDDDWLIEQPDSPWKGTAVTMGIQSRSERTTIDVFNRYTLQEDVPAFDKTHVPLRLFKMGEENLVSRSQAKRVLARYNGFKEVLLDFSGVTHVGQAFADEIFRVFRNQHPEVRVLYIRANDEIEDMIDHVHGK